MKKFSIYFQALLFIIGVAVCAVGFSEENIVTFFVGLIVALYSAATFLHIVTGTNNFMSKFPHWWNKK